LVLLAHDLGLIVCVCKNIGTAADIKKSAAVPVGSCRNKNFFATWIGWQRKALATKISNYGPIFSGDFF
jgi:hypothetical protein